MNFVFLLIPASHQSQGQGEPSVESDYISKMGGRSAEYSPFRGNILLKLLSTASVVPFDVLRAKLADQ